MTATRSVTVIVPIFNGLPDLERCLASVLRHRATTTTPFELLLIDDASPDAEVRAHLDAVVAAEHPVPVTVHVNDENVGFVQTCNRGMRETSGDVVLLNADTIVTEGWLDRLTAAAREPRVATVTPLTNFGSICTLPDSVIAFFGLDGTDPDIDACAQFVRAQSLERRPEVITGVGFCMYMTRAAIDAVGQFDAETFGLGYGEEVDFCLRASAAGFRHLVEDSTFVYHRGGVSFSERRRALLKTSSALIHARHPDFRARNRREREADPLRVSFAALDLGLGPRDATRPHVLQLLHSRPGGLGGTEKHFWRLMEAVLDTFDVSVLQPFRSGFLLTTLARTVRGLESPVELHIPADEPADTGVDDPAAASALRTALDLYQFDAVHIQNIIHHSLAALDVLAEFEGPVSCSVRDLYLACPHHWLLYRNTQSCGIPEDLSYCARCLPETRGRDVEYLESFRQTVSQRLGAIDHWVFATQSAMDFFLRVYEVEPARTTIIEHGVIIDHDRPLRTVNESRIFDEPLRVAFVGMGWAKKGLLAVNELAECFAGSSVEFHHFGELREATSPRIHVHGHYDNNVLPELLERAGIQVILLPGAFIETFGHVLTESMVAGLPVIGSRWGALGERIRRHEIGWTVDPEDVDGMRELITNLDRCRLELRRATRRAVDVDLRTVAETAEQYVALYRTEPPRSTPSGAAPGGMPATMDENDRLHRELRAMAKVNRDLYAALSEERDRAARSGRLLGPVRRVRASVVRRGVLGTATTGSRSVVRRIRARLG